MSSYPFCLCKYEFSQARQLCQHSDYFHKVIRLLSGGDVPCNNAREQFWGMAGADVGSVRTGSRQLGSQLERCRRLSTAPGAGAGGGVATGGLSASGAIEAGMCTKPSRPAPLSSGALPGPGDTGDPKARVEGPGPGRGSAVRQHFVPHLGWVGGSCAPTRAQSTGSSRGRCRPSLRYPAANSLQNV